MQSNFRLETMKNNRHGYRVLNLSNFRQTKKPLEQILFPSNQTSCNGNGCEHIQYYSIPNQLFSKITAKLDMIGKLREVAKKIPDYSQII